MGLSKPQSLEERRASLNAWQHREKHKFNLEEFAKAGFFFEQSFDIHDDPGRLRCAFCPSVIGNWLPEDDPWKEHILSVDYCPHVVQYKGEEFVERMLQEESEIEDDNDKEQERELDGTSNFDLFGFPPSILTSNEQNANRSPAYRSGTFNKDMKIAEHRVKSFSGVHSNTGTQSNNFSHTFFSQLAASGFYFEGLDKRGLRVRCFSCGLYLCNMDDNKEDVWRTHAQMSDCEHVKKRKGIEFISQVRAQTREDQTMEGSVAKPETTEQSIISSPINCPNTPFKHPSCYKSHSDWYWYRGRLLIVEWRTQRFPRRKRYCYHNRQLQARAGDSDWGGEVVFLCCKLKRCWCKSGGGQCPLCLQDR